MRKRCNSLSTFKNKQTNKHRHRIVFSVLSRSVMITRKSWTVFLIRKTHLHRSPDFSSKAYRSEWKVFFQVTLYCPRGQSVIRFPRTRKGSTRQPQCSAAASGKWGIEFLAQWNLLKPPLEIRNHEFHRLNSTFPSGIRKFYSLYKPYPMNPLLPSRTANCRCADIRILSSNWQIDSLKGMGKSINDYLLKAFMFIRRSRTRMFPSGCPSIHTNLLKTVKACSI